MCVCVIVFSFGEVLGSIFKKYFFIVLTCGSLLMVVIGNGLRKLDSFDAEFMNLEWFHAC